ncbi:MAG TPA: metallophosphoesterase [Sphingobacteriaceae bacterium]|nr:metallophosphoesterase [Sphingobacteriaceae bacterium]
MNRILKYFLLWCLLSVGTELFSQSNNEPLFKFGVIADVQYADRDNHGTRHYRASLNKLTNAVNVFNKEDVSFVMSLGDFINDDFKNFDTLNSITANLKMPLFHVIGNHDFSVAADKKEEVLKALKLKKDYYSFRKKNWRFIVLNGDDVSLIANHEQSEKYKQASAIFNKLTKDGAPNAKPWNGTLSTEQVKWMKNELATASKKNQQVILFCHFPLYPDKSPHTLWNSEELRGIIESYPNVKAYFNGHTHVSQYFLKGDVNYISFKGMVEKDENAFAIVSVYKDRLEIKGYGEEINRILK